MAPQPQSNPSQAVALATGPTTRGLWRVALMVAPQVAALALLILTEVDAISRAAFLLGWIVLSLSCVALIRRPALAGGLALATLAVLILLSRLKYDVMQMTVNFVDVMMINRASVDYLFTIFPDLWRPVGLAVLAAAPLAYMLWRFDPFRIRRLHAAAGAGVAMVALVALSLMWPHDPWEGFFEIRQSITAKALSQVGG